MQPSRRKQRLRFMRNRLEQLEARTVLTPFGVYATPSNSAPTTPFFSGNYSNSSLRQSFGVSAYESLTSAAGFNGWSFYFVNYSQTKFGSGSSTSSLHGFGFPYEHKYSAQFTYYSSSSTITTTADPVFTTLYNLAIPDGPGGDRGATYYDTDGVIDIFSSPGVRTFVGDQETEGADPLGSGPISFGGLELAQAASVIALPGYENVIFVRNIVAVRNTTTAPITQEIGLYNHLYYSYGYDFVVSNNGNDYWEDGADSWYVMDTIGFDSPPLATPPMAPPKR